MLKLAVVFCAALLPLTLKVGAAVPLGVVVAAQLYVRLPAPVSKSAPSAERTVVVPVTVPGAAAAAVATLGGWSVTLTALLPPIDALVAVTAPPAVVWGAVNRPLESIADLQMVPVKRNAAGQVLVPVAR